MLCGRLHAADALFVLVKILNKCVSREQWWAFSSSGFDLVEAKLNHGTQETWVRDLRTPLYSYLKSWIVDIIKPCHDYGKINSTAGVSIFKLDEIFYWRIPCCMRTYHLKHAWNRNYLIVIMSKLNQRVNRTFGLFFSRPCVVRICVRCHVISCILVNEAPDQYWVLECNGHAEPNIFILALSQLWCL